MSDRAALVLHTGKAAVDQAREGLVDGITYLDVYAADAAPDAAVAVPAFEPERATLATIDGLMARHPFDHVVSTSESNVAFAAFLRGRYGLPGPSLDQVLPATNKWRMKQLVGPAYPTAACRLSGELAELEQLLGAPGEVVVKPLSGSSTKGVRRVSPDRARALAAGGELLVVEEALDVDEELHVDGVVSGGRPEIVLPSVYDQPVLASVGDDLMSIHLPPHDPRYAAATAAARSVLPLFDLPDFVFHLELLRCGDRLLFGEMGMRPPGGGRADSLIRFCGADLWRDFLSVQMGLPAPSGTPHPPDTYCGVVGLGVRPGRPERTPSIAEMAAVPGVVEVRGCDVARSRREAEEGSSVAYTHLVYLAGPSEAAVRATHDAVRRTQLC